MLAGDKHIAAGTPTRDDDLLTTAVRRPWPRSGRAIINRPPTEKGPVRPAPGSYRRRRRHHPSLVLRRLLATHANAPIVGRMRSVNADAGNTWSVTYWSSQVAGRCSNASWCFAKRARGRRMLSGARGIVTTPFSNVCMVVASSAIVKARICSEYVILCSVCSSFAFFATGYTRLRRIPVASCNNVFSGGANRHKLIVSFTQT